MVRPVKRYSPTKELTQMAANALIDALATTWEPSASLSDVLAFDAETGSDLATRVCLRIHAAKGEIDSAYPSDWMYVGRATVGSRGKGYDSVPYTHAQYERTIRIEACMMIGSDLQIFAVSIRAYRYGKNGKVRLCSEPAIIGIPNNQQSAFIYETTVAQVLVTKALGL